MGLFIQKFAEHLHLEVSGRPQIQQVPGWTHHFLTTTQTSVPYSWGSHLHHSSSQKPWSLIFVAFLFPHIPQPGHPKSVDSTSLIDCTSIHFAPSTLFLFQLSPTVCNSFLAALSASSSQSLLNTHYYSPPSISTTQIWSCHSLTWSLFIALHSHKLYSPSCMAKLSRPSYIRFPFTFQIPTCVPASLSALPHTSFPALPCLSALHLQCPVSQVSSMWLSLTSLTSISSGVLSSEKPSCMSPGASGYGLIPPQHPSQPSIISATPYFFGGGATLHGMWNLPDQGSNQSPVWWKCRVNYWTTGEVLPLLIRSSCSIGQLGTTQGL